MAGRHLCLFDIDKPLDTFADRYPYPLYQYIQSPPKPDDRVLTQSYDFAEFPLSEIVSIFGPVENDVLEIELLDRRVQFQAIRISVLRPVEGLILAPFTFSGATFSDVDCGSIHEAVYLPFGGVLDASASLAETAFVLDVPDYIGMQIKSDADISELHIQTTVMYSNSFSGLGLNNRNKFTELVL
jgi:hypothetical protein